MTAPGWYADPLGRAELRWYNGATWGDQVRTGRAEGQDPIDLAGTPAWAAPRWVADPSAGVPAAPNPTPGPVRARGIGRGTVVALSVVVGLTVLLVVVGAVAVVTLVRNVPTLTGEQIEVQVGRELSAQVGSPVALDCPSVTYAGGADGTIECVATGAQLPVPLRVEVMVRDAAVRRWEVLPEFEPGDAA